MIDTKLKERQQLCKDLEEAVIIEYSLLEHIIDEYVYLIDDNKVIELQKIVDENFR